MSLIPNISLSGLPALGASVLGMSAPKAVRLWALSRGIKPRPPRAGQSRALAPSMKPTQSVVPFRHILNLTLIWMGFLWVCPTVMSSSRKTTAPSRGIRTPPATPRKASGFDHLSSRWIGCFLSPSLRPCLLQSSSISRTISSVVEFTPEPPSSIS